MSEPAEIRVTGAYLYKTNTGNEGDVIPASADDMFPVVDGVRQINLNGYLVLPMSYFSSDMRNLHEKLRTENDELQREAAEDHAKFLKMMEAVGHLVNTKGRYNTQTAFNNLRDVYDSLGK
jgi:hypothetical protein